MSTELTTQRQGYSLQQLMPQNLVELGQFAAKVAATGMWKKGKDPLTQQEAFIIMAQGVELGLTPLQALREISLIKGKPFVSGNVLAAKIRGSSKCVGWEPETSTTYCRIRARRRGEDWQEVSVSIDDIPKRMFSASPSGEPSNWTTNPEDMLYWWTVRRVGRRIFPDLLIGLQEDGDSREVIDVRAVERETGNDTGTYGPCTMCSDGTLYLQGKSSGGAYLRCNTCGATAPPPQEVRDTIRGRAQEFLEAPPVEQTETLPIPEPEPEEDNWRAEQSQVIFATLMSLEVDERRRIAEPYGIKTGIGLTLAQQMRTLDDDQIRALHNELTNPDVPEPA